MEGTIVIPKAEAIPGWASSFMEMTDKFYSKLADTNGILGEKLTTWVNNNNVDHFIKNLKGLQDSKFIKDKKKQLKDWFKQFMGLDPVSKERRKDYKQFLKNLWKNLGDLRKSLKGVLNAVYGNWFTTLLKLLLFMSIFDPKGKFLSSILGFLVKMVLQVIDLLLEYLPMIIENLIGLVTTVLPRVLNEIIDTVFSWISAKFQKLADNANNPALKWLFQQLADGFGKDGVLTEFFKFLAKYIFPLVIGVGLVLPTLLTIFGVIGSIISGAIAVFSFIGTVIGGIMTVVTFIGAIPLLIIAAVIAIGVIIYKYRKEIKDFFVKAWSTVKSLAVSAWKSIKNFFSSIPGKLKEFGKMILDSITAPFKKIFSILSPIFETVAKVFRPVGKVLKSIWDLIQNYIVNSFRKVLDFFAMFSDLSFSQLTSAESRTTYMQTREMAREKGIDMGKVEKAIEGEKGVILNSAEQQMVQQLSGYQGVDFKEKMREFIDDKEAINKVSRIKGVDINKTPEE